MPRLCAIVAMGRNRVIGTDGHLPWRLPDELRLFKRLTMGKPLIIGRTTWESFGGKPLPGRPHIILSRSPRPHAQEAAAQGLHWAGSWQQAVALAEVAAAAIGAEEIMVAGGADVYRQALPFCQRLYCTLVDDDPTGDTFFPSLNADDFPHRSLIAEGDGPPPWRMQACDRRIGGHGVGL
jgi:dihydrofolate reductase